VISTVSEMLNRFIEEEQRRLRQFHLAHAPTIGSMYEGLTAAALNRAIPHGLGLDVVSGFVTDDSGDLSPQIDCMLVSGTGEKVSYTNSFKWHIKDVIAVLEVKKSLYSGELKASYDTLRAVLNNQINHVQAKGENTTYDIESALRTFAQMTGKIAPERPQLKSLPFHEQMLYHCLMCERTSPVRIAIGYDGFRSEFSLREAFAKYLRNNLLKQGFGVMSFPQLIISGKYSLVKTNGEPYISRLEGDGWWNVLVSTNENPLRLILELIWTRLVRQYGISDLWGEDLYVENVNRFIRTKCGEKEGRVGWEYDYVFARQDVIDSPVPPKQWEPQVLNLEQYVTLNRLCAGEVENLKDPEFIAYIEQSGQTVDQFVARLLETQLVALDGDVLCLTTEQCQCAILSDGRYVAAENNSGRLTRWLLEYKNK
jgi:hypothetical protein